YKSVTHVLLQKCYPCPESYFLGFAYNELGYTTLSVAEPRRGVSVGATSCIARSVTEDNVPLGRARAKVPSGACQPQLYDVTQSTILV
ncbi:hypothetical protein LPTSP4_36640, partial [Leptospira ryugenii]